MKKRLIINLCLIILLATIVVYKYPIEVNKAYNGYLLYNGATNSENPVSISLTGKLVRNIVSDNTFVGAITINGDETHVETRLPSNMQVRLNGIMSKMKNNPLSMQGSALVNGDLRVTCVVHISRDLKTILGHTDYLREKYKSNDLIFVAPAQNEEEAKNVRYNLIYKYISEKYHLR